MELQNLWIFGLHNPHAVSLLQCIFADCKPDSVVKLLKHLLKLSFSCHMPCQSYLSVECWVHMPLNVKKCKNFHVFKMRCLRSLTTEYGSQSAKIHCKCGTVCGLYSPKTQLYFIKNVDFGIFMPFMGILKQTSLYGL